MPGDKARPCHDKAVFHSPDIIIIRDWVIVQTIKAIRKPYEARPRIEV